MRIKLSLSIAIMLVMHIGISRAQLTLSNIGKDEIVTLEKSFADAVKAQDSLKAGQLQSDSFFLAIGIQNTPLQIITKPQWLSTLKYYVTESYSIDDISVNIYGSTAIVIMLYTQKAMVRGQDRSAQFLITDIWNKESAGWKIAERHSSRPEQRNATKLK